MFAARRRAWSWRQQEDGVSLESHAPVTSSSDLKRGTRGTEKEDAPAFQRIHELSGHIQALAHQGRLMANSLEGVTQQTDLVLWRGGGSHAVGRGLVFVMDSMLRIDSGPLASSSAPDEKIHL